MAGSEFRIVTPLARLSYPNLFKPAKPMSEGQEAKYQCELIFPPGTDLSALKKVASDCAKAKWADKVPKNLRTPFRKGDEDRDGKDGYEGAIFIGARSKDKPGIVVGPNREECLDQSEVYGGCYVRASITAFAYSNAGNNGVAFALNNVWKVKDGEPFGSRRSAEDDFADAGSSSDFDTADSLL